MRQRMTPEPGRSRDTPADMRVNLLLSKAREDVHAPPGFGRRVMDIVYREALAPDAARRRARLPAGSPMYRRLGWSFVLTAAVLSLSLLLPRGGYSTFIRSAGSGAVLGDAPSAAVQGALVGAAEKVQGALGEKQIGGNKE